ncbi:conjugal transfer protein TraH [Amycolatopsis sp. NBC_00348]|uniref:conjugal transfer protein TraH n=1 Tax=unclassified Amycolatopsis TaxID=2618356 RepID=UPI002E256249|nr:MULTISPECIES: conjugal transfer protein TraH [unclassified Amycolatopsis]
MSRDERCRTRQETAVAWAGSHAVELAGVGVPLVAGAVWWPWFDLISGLAAALWAANEIRLHRTTRTARQAVVTTPPPARQLSTATAPETGVPQDTNRKEAKA